MAGTILIDKGIGVAFNSFGYHRVMEAIRANLDADAVLATKDVFEPNDVACMQFISLIDADPAAFQCFERAATTAYARATTDGLTFPEWDEFMEKLLEDPRSHAA